MAQPIDAAHADTSGAYRDPARRLANVILLAPSRGLGGGIERFVSTVQTALVQEQVPYRRLDLLAAGQAAGIGARLRFVAKAVRAVRASRTPVRLVVAHSNLLPIVRLVAGYPNFDGAIVFLYGCDIWGRRIRGRRVMRRADVRVVTISNFSAGALAGTCPANVLHPGVSSSWYQTLVDASTRARPVTDELSVVTAFRLGDWRDKGLGTLLEALRLLGDDRVRLTVCGSGPVPPDLAARVAPHPWCRIEADLCDQTLAEHLAAADLFVLATRTRFGAAACGEGFGLVLLEAQLAGTPVIAPAYGGSSDAFQFGLTGLAPINESPEALASVLARLLADNQRRTEMARAAATWSRTRFEPTAHGRHVVETLLAP